MITRPSAEYLYSNPSAHLDGPAMFPNSTSMRNLHTVSREEDVELGLSTLSGHSSAPNMPILTEYTSDDDDLGGEYHRMENIYNSWRSEEWIGSHDQHDLDDLAMAHDGGIDWENYREAMVLGGQVLNKDKAASLDKFTLLRGHFEGEEDLEDFEDIFRDAMVIINKNEKIPMHDHKRLMEEECGCRSRKQGTMNGSCSVKEEKISRPSSVNQRLRRNSLLLGAANRRELMNNICTTVLILVTVIAIIFLFWLQNSSFHIGHVEPWPAMRTQQSA